MFPFRLYTLLAGGTSAAFAAYLLFGRKKKTPAEIERERRDWLNQIGRITDGTVIDVQEVVPNGRPAATMLIFQYDVRRSLVRGFPGRDSSAPMDQPSLLPSWPAHVSSLRSAKSRQLDRRF